MPGPLAGAEQVEGLCAAAAELAARIRKEAAEEDLDPDLFDESAEMAAIEKAMAEVTFSKPPGSVQEAIAAYRNVASNRPYVLLSSLFWTVLIAGDRRRPDRARLEPLVGIVAGAHRRRRGVPDRPPGLLGALPLGDRFGEPGRARGLGARVRARPRLELRDRWRFHADHRHLPLPGFADHVLAGPLPGTQLEALLRLLRRRGRAALGGRGDRLHRRPAAGLERRSSSALHPPPSAEALAKVKLPDEYRAEVGGEDLLVYRPIQGNLLHRRAGTDRFREHAAEVIRGIIGA